MQNVSVNMNRSPVATERRPKMHVFLILCFNQNSEPTRQETRIEGVDVIIK